MELIIDNTNLTVENIEMIILSIFKSDIIQIKKTLNIDFENLNFPNDFYDSDYDDYSNNEEKSKNKNNEDTKPNIISYSNISNFNLFANELNTKKIYSNEFFNSPKFNEFKNVISQNIPGISELNQKGITFFNQYKIIWRIHYKKHLL